MASGLKIKNTAGTILIDDKYPMLHVRAAGTATLGSDGSFFIGNYQSGQLALRSTSIVSAMRFGAIQPYSAGLYLFGPPGASVQWWLYDEPQEPASRIGMVIRRSGDRKLIFDALKKPARVAAFRVGSSSGAWQGPGALDGSRAWAVMLLSPAFISAITFTRVGSTSPNEFFQREDVQLAGMSVSGGTVNFGYTQPVRREYGPFTGTNLPSNYTVQSQSASMAIVDMTNY